MCALYNPPVEELTEFNTAVFKQDDTPLTKMKSLFLGRVGNPISVATSTRFNGGDIYVQGSRVGLGAGSIATNTAFGYNALISNTTGANNLAIGYSALDANTYGFNNVAIGTNSGGAITTGSRNVAIGFEAFKTGTIHNNSVALGASTVVSGNQAVAIGYLASASDSQIVLGTSAETVLCKGTTGNVSLIASADIYAKSSIRMGMGNNNTYTTPETSEQTAFGYGSHSAATSIVKVGSTGFGYKCLGSASYRGGNNTGVGSSCLQALTFAINMTAIGFNAGKSATSVGASTFVGAYSGVNVTSGGNNTLVGCVQTLAAGALNTGSFNTLIGNNAETGENPNSCSSLGAYTYVGDYSRSTAIGGGSDLVNGARCTVSNQIMLGTTAEFVQCPGTTTTGSIKLGGSIQLQASYSVAPSSVMLGFQLQGSTAFNDAILPDDVTSTSFNLTAGVWSISTTYEFKNVHVSQATEVYRYHMYISFTNGGAFANRYLYGGTLGFVNYVTAITYPPDPSPVFAPELPSVYSTSFTYYTDSSKTLYPTFMMAAYGGTLNRNVRYTATRIG